MSAILTNFANIRVTNRYYSELQNRLRDEIERVLYLKKSTEIKPPEISNNMIARLCFIAGLATEGARSLETLDAVRTSEASGTLHETVFSRDNRSVLWSALIKLRYVPVGVDLEKNNMAYFRRAVSYEIERGAEFLLKDDNLRLWFTSDNLTTSSAAHTIPELKLHLGAYEDDTEARLNYNRKNIPNTQTLIAGTTGSGKSNLLAVILNELRMRSAETAYPVNFLLFDYKSEFSDPANKAWLEHLMVRPEAILSPVKSPLPINPFEDMTTAEDKEVNLYSMELANALLVLDRTTISANMNNRLSEAIIDAYKKTKGKPIHFQLILDQYNDKLGEKEREKGDSITSVLSLLIKQQLFSEADTVNLVNESFIINMQGIPRNGLVAKAIVYFLVAKMNYYFKTLPPQQKSEEYVALRHFTVIDEAHNMLDFDNPPLRNLIAEGRSKGLSIILATQNMAHFESKHFDFFTNAHYPLIMKQQTLDNSILKDLFGVSGDALEDVRKAVSGLQLGEVILKNHEAAQLGIGKPYKKIKVRHLI